MNQTCLKRIGGIALGALAAVCLTCATDATACSLPGIPGLKTVYPADTSALLSAASAALPHSSSGSAAPSASAARNGPASVVGLWQVTYSSGSTIVDMAFEVFHDDGTEILNDITAPAEGNVCLGVWTQTARTTYKLTHPSWTFDANGNLTGTGLFGVTVTLTSADKFTGTYTLDFFDTSGNPTGVYNGTLAATRIFPSY